MWIKKIRNPSGRSVSDRDQESRYSPLGKGQSNVISCSPIKNSRPRRQRQKYYSINPYAGLGKNSWQIVHRMAEPSRATVSTRETEGSCSLPRNLLLLAKASGIEPTHSSLRLGGEPLLACFFGIALPRPSSFLLFLPRATRTRYSRPYRL